MTPTEMEERVALVLCEATDCGPNSLTGRCPALGCKAMQQARAAIRAMHEPTEEMISARLNVPVLGPNAKGRDYFLAEWRAAINAASPEVK